EKGREPLVQRSERGRKKEGCHRRKRRREKAKETPCAETPDRIDAQLAIALKEKRKKRERKGEEGRRRGKKRKGGRG
ncbi:hypothetical protein, partial [Extibacter muris]|uniref:hypothetical protein n=1 Tax=Extibacter muris TaxID=1796622 RepID=UPI001911DA42